MGPIGADVPIFVSTFREAMKVLRVPAPPSFRVDPATGIVIAPTEGGALNTEDAGKPTSGVAVDVAV